MLYTDDNIVAAHAVVYIITRLILGIYIARINKSKML